MSVVAVLKDLHSKFPVFSVWFIFFCLKFFFYPRRLSGRVLLPTTAVVGGQRPGGLLRLGRARALLGRRGHSLLPRFQDVQLLPRASQRLRFSAEEVYSRGG